MNPDKEIVTMSFYKNFIQKVFVIGVGIALITVILAFIAISRTHKTRFNNDMHKAAYIIAIFSIVLLFFSVGQLGLVSLVLSILAILWSR